MNWDTQPLLVSKLELRGSVSDLAFRCRGTADFGKWKSFMIRFQLNNSLLTGVLKFMILSRSTNQSFYFCLFWLQINYFIISYIKRWRRIFHTKSINWRRSSCQELLVAASIKVFSRFTCAVSFRVKNCDTLVRAIFKKVFVDSRIRS